MTSATPTPARTTTWHSIFDIKDAWNLAENVEDTDSLGYGTAPYYEFYGVGIIVFAAIGITGNIITILVFLNKSMRTPFGVFMISLLVSDIVYLTCQNLVHVPGAWLDKIPITSLQFESHLHAAQQLYMSTYAAAELAQSLVAWFTFTVVGEQFCIIYLPHIALKLSSTEKTLKVCVTVLCLTILVHLIHFFKFVLRPIGMDNYSRICLSNIYIYPAFQWYDQYGHFMLFMFTAWVMIFVMLVAISLGLITARYNIGDVLGDQRLFRVFKSGRSIRTSVAVGSWYVVFATFSHVTQMSAWYYGSYGGAHNLNECHFRPNNRRFLKAPAHFELLYDLGGVLNSSLRLPIVLIANSKFRRIIRSCCVKQHEVAQRITSIITFIPKSEGEVDENHNIEEQEPQAFNHPQPVSRQNGVNHMARGGALQQVYHNQGFEGQEGVHQPHDLEHGRPVNHQPNSVQHGMVHSAQSNQRAAQPNWILSNRNGGESAHNGPSRRPYGKSEDGRMPVILENGAPLQVQEYGMNGGIGRYVDTGQV